MKNIRAVCITRCGTKLCNVSSTTIPRMSKRSPRLHVEIRYTRSGTVLICVLACIVIASAMIVTTMQSALRGRREARLNCQLRQTEFLCEAGILRASQQLNKSFEYTGEQWRPKLDIPAFEGVSASVDIRITPLPNANSRRVEVIAHFDSATASNGPMQRSHSFTVERPSSLTSENK